MNAKLELFYQHNEMSTWTSVEINGRPISTLYGGWISIHHFTLLADLIRHSQPSLPKCLIDILEYKVTTWGCVGIFETPSVISLANKCLSACFSKHALKVEYTNEVKVFPTPLPTFRTMTRLNEKDIVNFLNSL